MMRQFVFAGLIIAHTAMGSLAQGLGGFRNVEILVHDEAGKPLQEATVGVNAADLDFPLSVDKEGIASLNLPNEAGQLVLKASCPGYISLEVRWSAENIPQSFTFNMSKGEPIGGIVHDERGKPIKGVMVEGLLVSSRVAADGQVLPLVGGELAKTDDEGRWRADVATSEPLQLRLKLSHDDYFSDVSFGKRRVGNEQLRGLDHVEVMDDRIPPQGIVRDSSGNSIANAALYLAKGYDKLILENGAVADDTTKPITRSGKDGKYQFAEQEEEFVVLCLADQGWALEPSRRYAKNEPVDIILTPWSQVQGVLSQNGKPAPNQKLQLAVYYDDFTTDSGQVEWKNLATTNEKGEFRFEKLPNGYVSIGGSMDYCGGSEFERSDFSIEAQAALQPGAQTAVLVDRRGALVTGTVVPLRDGSEAAITCGMISLEKQDEAGDIVRNLFFEWGKAASIGIEFDPIDNAARNAARLKSPPRLKYLAQVDAEGRFHFDYLPPGKYRATVHIRAEHSEDLEAAWLTGDIWEAFPVAPAAGAEENKVDLGLLEFEVYESEE